MFESVYVICEFVALEPFHSGCFKSILWSFKLLVRTLQTDSFWFFCRILYLGLTLGLRTLSFFLCISGFAFLKRHIRREERYSLSNGSAELDSLRKEENGSVLCEHCLTASDGRHDRETCL